MRPIEIRFVELERLAANGVLPIKSLGISPELSSAKPFPFWGRAVLAGGKMVDESATISHFPGIRGLRAPKAGSQQPINWRRGLFRLWVLLSAAWVLGWGVDLAIWSIRTGAETPGDLFAIPVLLLGPPAALLVFGHATAWALRGFVPDSRSP
jgi:hypothetical protein